MAGTTLDTSRFDFIQQALDGSGGFADGSHLVQYARESTDKYTKRKALSWYVNHIKPLTTNFIGYLSKKGVDREVLHPFVEAFVQNCDWKNNSIDIFLSNFYVTAKAKGCGLILCDMPKQQPATLGQQIEERFFPYLISLSVESVRSYSLNAQGTLDSIGIAASEMIDGKLQEVIRGWDKQKWWVNLNGVTIEGDDHGLGACPVLIFSESDTFPYVGNFAQIAYISKRLYNMASELDEILRSQTFGILTYQIPPEQAGQLDVAKLSESVGTHNMLVFSGNAAPSFVSPAPAPAEIYLKTIATLEEKIKDIGLSIDFSGNSSSESGVALTIRFQALNSALSQFAKRGEDMERRLFDMVSRWLKIQNTTKVSYPKSFEVADVKAELDMLSLYQTAAFPQEVIQEKMKQIAALDFSNMEPDELQALLETIDQMDSETPLLESRVSILEANTQPPDTNHSDSNFNADMPTNDMGGDQQ